MRVIAEEDYAYIMKTAETPRRWTPRSTAIDGKELGRRYRRIEGDHPLTPRPPFHSLTTLA